MFRIVAVAAVVLTGCKLNFEERLVGPDAPGDGIPDDGTSLDAPVANYVFLTSTQHDLCAMGVAGADAMCVDRAIAANLPGTYRAWVSSATENAKDRLGGARGWIRTDGRPFADRIEDALVGNVFFPPRLDESGADLGFVWIQTATQASGIYDSSNGCNLGGLPSNGGTLWGSDTLIGQAHVLCFGIDHVTPVSHPSSPGRVAFTSRGLFTPTTGIDSADALCTTEATTAAFPGTYKAFMATTTTAAPSRFDLTGPIWVRTDGVPLMENAANLATWTMLSGVERHADGAVANRRVWTGRPTLSTLANTCNNWTSSAPSGVKTSSTESFDRFFTDGLGCAVSLPVFCLQQ